MPSRRSRQQSSRSMDQVSVEDSTEELHQLSISDNEGEPDGEQDDGCDVQEEECYVKACLIRAQKTFNEVMGGGEAERDGWGRLETDLAVEFEYSSWPMICDETLSEMIEFLYRVLVEIGERVASVGLSEVSPQAIDCAFAAFDVLEGMMETRFILNMGEQLDKPFDEKGSLTIFRALVLSLRLVVTMLESSSGMKGAKVDAARVKSFTVTDDHGMQSVLHKSHAYEPLQYLLTVLNLLSYMPVQTDRTCFWWDSETVLEDIWCNENLQLLVRSMEVALEHVDPRSTAPQTLMESIVDRWVHTLLGTICTDTIGRQISITVPDEDSAPDTSEEKPGIEAITGVSTYLGRWMDVRCLRCECHFCKVQKEAMECMLARWDKRLVHRFIDMDGIMVIGKVFAWLLRNHQRDEEAGRTEGEDLYRTDVALNVQIVHLCVLSDYDCCTLAEERTRRARTVKQAIDSGFLNFLLRYFIPRKLCRLDDRRSETSEDQNRARRIARIACKNCIEFLLLSPDGWITDTCYNAKGSVVIDRRINERMAPAAARLIELFKRSQQECATTAELLDDYAPFFIKLCEIIRLSSRYGWMKDLWDADLLNNAVNVIATYSELKLEAPSDGMLPHKKALLCAMATFCDMCHPSFGARDHFLGASRAVHDAPTLKTLLDTARSSRTATSCIRALSYVSRVEVVTMVSTKNALRPEQTKMVMCAQCHRPPTAERPLKQCGRCQQAYYCSIDCQRENWKSHEPECVKPCNTENVHKRVKMSGASSTMSSSSPTTTSGGSGGGSAMCAQCGSHAEGRDSKRLMKCGRCRDVHYCSKECQTKHWNVHRKACDDAQDTSMMAGTNTL